MICLSLRVTAGAGSGLKIRAHQRPDLPEVGANKRVPGIYRRIAYSTFVSCLLCCLSHNRYFRYFFNL